MNLCNIGIINIGFTGNIYSIHKAIEYAGGKVGLIDHVNVGDFASIAAGSGVMNDIPTKEVWSGVPAMPIRDHMRALSANRKLGKKIK